MGASYLSKLRPHTQWHQLSCWLASSWGTHRKVEGIQKSLTTLTKPAQTPRHIGRLCGLGQMVAPTAVTWQNLPQYDGENVIKLWTYTLVLERLPGTKFHIIILVWTRTKYLWCFVKIQTEQLCIEGATLGLPTHMRYLPLGKSGDTFGAARCQRLYQWLFVPSCKRSGPTYQHWGHLCRSTNIRVC